MQPDTGMNQEERMAMSQGLNKVLADEYVLYVLIQQFHWNVHGPSFYSLHILSEKHYEELTEMIDEIAERIRALGFFVEGSLEAFIKLTSIPQETAIHPTHVWIEKLLNAHEVVIRELRSLGAEADRKKDYATTDLVGRYIQFHEKACWMLRAHLQ